MKRFVKNIVLFSCCSILFYIVSLFIGGELFPNNKKRNLNYRLGGYGHMHTRLKEIKTYKNIDILFLGSSHTYRGFDPRVFKRNGFTSFNLGSSSQTPIQTMLLLERYLDELNPGLILYEVYPGSFGMDGVESALDLIANDDLGFDTIKMAVSLNHLKVYNTLVFAMTRNLLGLDENFVEPLYKGMDRYIKGGFVERKLMFFKEKKLVPRKKWLLHKFQLNAFEQIIGKIKKKNYNILLIQAPITKNVYHAYANNRDIDTYFQSLAPYYNFNNRLFLDSSLHFYDAQHLNQNGVVMFNMALLTLLKTENLLPGKPEPGL